MLRGTEERPRRREEEALRSERELWETEGRGWREGEGREKKRARRGTVGIRLHWRWERAPRGIEGRQKKMGRRKRKGQ